MRRERNRMILTLRLMFDIPIGARPANGSTGMMDDGMKIVNCLPVEEPNIAPIYHM